MFPAGAPGIALLILRISLAGALLYEAPSCAKLGSPALIYLTLSLLSLSLCIGFFTPILSMLAGAVELITVLVVRHPDLPFAVLAGLNTIAIALVGPGAYSLDAKLFGRREITFPARKEPGSYPKG